MNDEYFMQIALEEAKAAYEAGEVPVGCLIVLRGEIIGRGRNRCAERGNALYHAEIIAINQACGHVGDWRLTESVLYATIEPCPMCAGAIIMSRIGRVVFGARNRKAGCVGSIFDLLREPRFNHRADVTEGVLAEECGRLMTDFFRRHLAGSQKTNTQSH